MDIREEDAVQDAVARAVKAMGKIEDSSDRIGTIIGVNFIMARYATSTFGGVVVTGASTAAFSSAPRRTGLSTARSRSSAR